MLIKLANSAFLHISMLMRKIKKITLRKKWFEYVVRKSECFWGCCIQYSMKITITCLIIYYFVDFNSAAAKGNVQRIKSYAAAGANPTTAKDMYGRTALHAVCNILIIRIVYTIH